MEDKKINNIVTKASIEISEMRAKAVQGDSLARIKRLIMLARLDGWTHGIKDELPNEYKKYDIDISSNEGLYLSEDDFLELERYYNNTK